MAGLLGKRTAELHLALFSDKEEPDFAPERFSLLWQRSVFQSMQTLTKRVFRLLRSKHAGLAENVREESAGILNLDEEIIGRMKAIVRKKLSAQKIRTHGDYHLGQVLFTGKDFVIIDFEGEPARTLSERRLKKSPLRDVAGMIRSFHYAVYFSLLKEAPIRAEDRSYLEPWADLWYRAMGGAFLRSYLAEVGNVDLIPKDREELEIMLNAFLLDKAVYELGYELNNRPEWLRIPIRGLKHLLEVD
jgi:maltose alpha-D-glucosyltransferase/alpha-amylase